MEGARMSLRSSDRGGSAHAAGADVQPGQGTELQGLAEILWSSDDTVRRFSLSKLMKSV
jgi:hypothetical protein